MHETPTSFYNFENPVPGAVLPPGRHALRGWVLPKGGGHYADVRARAQGRFFSGVHGFPRTDLAAFFKTGRREALAEFSIPLDLAPGSAEVILEALDLEGCWREFTRLAYRIDPAGQPANPSASGGPLRWHDFCRSLGVILRARRAQPTASWPELAQAVAQDLPFPRDLLTPPLPFIGFLDEPAVINNRRFGQVPVIGHVFHTTMPTRQIMVSTDLQVLQPIDAHRVRPDVAAHYAQYPTAAACGYLGFADVPSQLPNPVAVRIYAELEDGSLHLVQVARVRVHDADEEKFSYAPAEPGAFDQALAAWREALRQRNLSVLEDADFQPGLARLRAEYAAQTGNPPVARSSRPTPASVGSATPPRRVLLATHNLSFEGAPLFLADYAQTLADAGVQLTVLSPSEGPLRARFEALGATVQLTDVSAVFASPLPENGRDAISALGRKYDFAAFDLVVANTFTTFWAVHAAKEAGRPVLLYVHESTTPAHFYLGRVPAAVVQLATEAFSVADAISFTTDATKAYHLDYGRPDRYCLTPGWIDVARIDQWMAQHSRDALRARFNLQPGELLVTNIGTVCERKGQHIFARAIDLLWRRHPELAARARFVMLGGGDTGFDDSLNELLTQMHRPNVTVHPSTADYFPYYAAADISVCSTFEESSPRVILEAMAFGTPILSSAVHGIPELVRAGREAVLVPPGDTAALCEGLAVLLADPALGRELAARARSRVQAEFSAERVLPRHQELTTVLAGQV